MVQYWYNLYVADFSQRYDNGDDPNSIFQDYPPYPDPYMSTYRSFSSWDFSKVWNEPTVIEKHA